MLHPLVISTILLVVFVIGGAMFSAVTKMFYALAFTGVGAIIIAFFILTFILWFKYKVPKLSCTT